MEFFEVENKNGIKIVRFNNVRKRNALNKKAYYALGDILNEAAKDPKTKAVVLTGNGEFFR
ncbi:MAG: enoyl-CoA hydratase-related protein [Propionibacteriaceae bacterium]